MEKGDRYGNRAMGHVLSKSILCVLPLALTPVWGSLIADGYLNFGGGEKDLFLLIPWILWSLLYLAVFAVGWIKGWALRKSLLYAIFGAGAGVIMVWLVLAVVYSGMLGAAGSPDS